MPFYQIPPPAPMNVKSDVSTNWKMFKEAWCYYVTATELNKKPKEVQAGALCSVMGMDCVKVMNSLTTLTASHKKDPEKILSALSDHFMPQKNLLFERVKFGFANQAENERIDQYVVRLCQLAESCEFENLCESLIRDRLVIGTRDSSTRDRLLRERPVPGLVLKLFKPASYPGFTKSSLKTLLILQTPFMQQKSIIQQMRKGKEIVVVAIET